jgi:acyl dehydratase
VTLIAARQSLPVSPVILSPGDTMQASFVGPLTRTDFVRYGGAGGDLNPIHHDEPLAQAAGLPSVFGMGMLPAGILGVRLARWVGPENIRAFSVRFTGRVWPGDELAFNGSVDAVEDGIALVTLSATRQNGELVLSATARALCAQDSPDHDARKLGEAA